ncbi:MAG: hypothetical protein IJJ45_01765 [Clostridia bacterium]|nr:hypothetical protein [Clostridia bacterium]
MTALADIRAPRKRIAVVTGHYGSGKTEFCVSLAMQLAGRDPDGYARLALADLDIINPYFRSRERSSLLESVGVSVYGSAYGHEVTAEIPELAANIRAPLEDRACRTLLDLGGNDAGAKVLRQFERQLPEADTQVFCVVNANRPETRGFDGAMAQLHDIERNLGRRVDAIINNTHLLRETDAECVLRGHRLCEQICRESSRELWCDCYPAGIVDPAELEGCEYPMPMGLYMRPAWLDR